MATSSFYLILAMALIIEVVCAAPVADDSRQKRDLMIEMEEDEFRDLFGGNLLNRKRRDLMLEGGDLDRMLLDYFERHRSQAVDELPIGKRSISMAQSETKRSRGRKRPIFIWFPDDTKHFVDTDRQVLEIN